MNNLSFSPLVPIPLLISLGLLLTLLFLYLEVKRKTSLLPARILALLLMMMSLILLFLQPSYLSTSTSSGYLLLTEHYDKDNVDSLLNAYPSLELIHTADAKPHKGSRLLQPYELAKLDPSIRFIVGEGLSLSDLDLLENKNISYLPTSYPMGITDLHLPKFVTVNEKQSLHGTFNTNNNTLLRLVGPGGVEDSVLLSANKTSTFSFSFKPLSTGQFLYSLEWTDKETIHREKIPVNVMPAKVLNTLILQAAPGIELRTLKNFLAEGNHGISVRSQLSKNKYRSEFINSPALNLSFLTTELLKKFDLVVLESSTLTTLSKGDRKSLEQAISEGLGILILLNSEPDKEKILQQFLPLKKRVSDQDTVSLVYENQQKFKVKLGPTQVESHPYLLPHVQKGSSVYAGHIPHGFGKIGFQCLEETYRLRLQGENDAYAYCWTDLLKGTSRDDLPSSKVRLQQEFPYYANEVIPFTLLSEAVPLVKSSNINIPLQEDIHIDNRWHGSVRFNSPGWQAIHNTTDSISYTFYISGEEEWSSLRLVHQMKLLRNKVKGFHETEEIVQTEERKNVTPWFFFALFLLSTGFLWLAPKL